MSEYEEDAEKFLTVGEVIRITGISPRTIARWIRQGDIPSILTAGGRPLVRRSDVEAFIVSAKGDDDFPEV